MWHVTFVSDSAVLNFEFGRRGTDVNNLVRQLHELIEVERSIIQGAGQPESILNKYRFARLIAFVHSADLRNGGVRFIHYEQKILREKIEQSEWSRPGRSSTQVPRIILDPIAEPHFLQHFQVVFGPHF